MDFRIADTFTDSLARLTGDVQKAMKTTAFDLPVNPAGPGMQFHRLDKAKDQDLLVGAGQQRHPPGAIPAGADFVASSELK